MSVTDLSVMAVDEFVPMETSDIVIRCNRRATQSKSREGLPRSTTRAHVVCALLRGQGQKREPPRIKKAVLTRWRCVRFVPTKTI